jgi:hypothetical protein
MMRVFPAPGFLSRLKGRLILMQLPHFPKFRRYLVNVWSGK